MESEELVVSKEGEEESQVVWQDPAQAEEMRLAVSRLSSGRESLRPGLENDQDLAGMEMETMGSLNIDDLTANMMEQDKEYTEQ